MPVPIRIPYGGGIGAVEHHSESPEAYFAHTAGLRVVSPSNPVDAYWMIQQAIASARSSRLLRAETSLLGQGRPRRIRQTVAAVQRASGTRGDGSNVGRLWPDGAYVLGGSRPPRPMA